MNDATHKNIYDALKKDILSGKYGSGSKLPSVSMLVRRFGASRATIHHAIEVLAHDGLVSRRQGSGTFVTKRGASRRIGLIVPGVAVTDFFKPVVSEINSLAMKAGYDLHFREVWSENRNERVAQVREFAAEFIKGNFAGVIYEPLAGPIGDEINPRR